MNCEIQNLTRRLVSIHCNSGKTCHLPPGYKHELPEQEISGNSFVKKLEDRKLIAVRQLSKTSASKESGKEETKAGEVSGTDKPSKKKSSATK